MNINSDQETLTYLQGKTIFLANESSILRVVVEKKYFRFVSIVLLHPTYGG